MGFGALAAMDADHQKLASANAGFAFKLLAEISKEQPGANVFISPFGAFTVLQMACNGAGGETKQEIQRVLGTASLLPEVVNGTSRDFDNSLNGRGTNIILNAANAIWYRRGTAVNPGFISCNQQFFSATVDGLDFDDPRSVGIMNAWVSEKTHGKITRIADGLVNKVTEMVLANAVYFKGKWERPFEVKSTKERPFHLRGSRQRMVPMMEQTRRFDYRRGSGYQAVRLRYEGWSLGMYVFLPDAGSSPEKLLGIMNGDKWQRVTEPGFSDRDGTVVLPKFRLEYGVELKQPLQALGMKSAFDKADFSGISERSLFVSAVRQGTFIEVNEEGTEAAAATMLTINSGMDLNPPKPFEMVVDRPFLFLIVDEQTKLILFIGVVFDPSVS
ncbi:MAG: serpin family protein [Verrucomicrobiota bacterium]